MKGDKKDKTEKMVTEKKDGHHEKDKTQTKQNRRQKLMTCHSGVGITEV